MNPKNDNHELQAAFLEFCNIPLQKVSPQTEQSIFRVIDGDLNPALARVFFALAVVHAASSFFTLTICPHFGIHLIRGFKGVGHWFMAAGPAVCMMACGGIFMATGILLALATLPRAYWRILIKHGLWVPAGLTFLSAAVLVGVGEVGGFEMVLFWMIGGVISAGLSFQVGARLRLGLI